MASARESSDLINRLQGSSFRTSFELKSLYNKTFSETNSFKLNRNCARLCLHEDKIWCPCYIELFTCVHIYTTIGSLVHSIKFEPSGGPQPIHQVKKSTTVRGLQSMQQLCEDHFIVAAANGLYVINIDVKKSPGQKNVTAQLLPGKFWDLDMHKGIIVALEKKSDKDQLHRIKLSQFQVFNAKDTEVKNTETTEGIENTMEKMTSTEESTISSFSGKSVSTSNIKQNIYNSTARMEIFEHNSFILENCLSENVIATKNHIFISFYEDFKQSYISQYNHKGDPLHTFGKFGKSCPGELDVLTLCAVDQQGALLVADLNNKRLQIVDTLSDKWSIVTEWTNHYQPVDVIFTDEHTMLVLCFNTMDKQHYIQNFQF